MALDHKHTDKMERALVRKVLLNKLVFYNTRRGNFKKREKGEGEFDENIVNLQL